MSSSRRCDEHCSCGCGRVCVGENFVSRPQHFFSRWDFLKKASTPWKTNQAEKKKKRTRPKGQFFFTRKLLSRNRKEWGRKRHSSQRRLLLRNGKEQGIHVRRTYMLMSAFPTHSSQQLPTNQCHGWWKGLVWSCYRGMAFTYFSRLLFCQLNIGRRSFSGSVH